jgi:C_GCAxxG_C_C family probable redox protein
VSNVERATILFRDGFNCSQAVFAALAPGLGLDQEMALRVAGPFGGGTARMGQICGAASGALMALGLKYSQTKAEDKEAKERTYALAREFLERFKAHNGAVCCRDLLGYDVGIPEQQQIAKEKGLFDSLCPRLVVAAVEIAEQYL